MFSRSEGKIVQEGHRPHRERGEAASALYATRFQLRTGWLIGLRSPELKAKLMAEKK